MYRIILNLHIISAFLIIGFIIFIAVKWNALSINKKGRETLKKMHLFTTIAGWVVLLSGIILLYIINGQFLLFNWMRFSIGLFLFIQIFDHFWADKQENKQENKNLSYLKFWLILKAFLYLSILALMYLKPI